MRIALPALVLVVLLAGCTSPSAPNAATDDNAASEMSAEPFLVKLTGNVVEETLDAYNHDQPSEQYIFPFQKAGWNIQIDSTPKAIEVRVDWEGYGEFALHPHYYLGDDETGRTQYYGYHSPWFRMGTGCIRLPEADMAPGIWPMMIHPRNATRNVGFTITVGILGGEGTVRPELHGHREDGKFDITEHKPGHCQFLGPSTGWSDAAFARASNGSFVRTDVQTFSGTVTGVPGVYECGDMGSDLLRFTWPIPAVEPDGTNVGASRLKVTMTSSATARDVDLYLYDPAGEFVNSSEVLSKDETIEVSAGPYPPGEYVIEVRACTAVRSTVEITAEADLVTA